MQSTDICVELQLEVIPPDKVRVPGCEPPSDATSRTLLQRWCCKSPYVNLADALAAIPGSWVKYGDNWNQPHGWRKRWFVLPCTPQACCPITPDYYKILRELANEEPQEELLYDYCDVLDQGFCPSPDFTESLPPEPDPYLLEGTNPYHVGVTLGPTPPPWQALPPGCKRANYYGDQPPPDPGAP